MANTPTDAEEHDEPDLLELVRRLGIASDRVGQAFAARQGLHPTDLQALLHVMEAEGRGTPLTAGQLGLALGLTSGATTGVIDRLSQQGHLSRRRDDRDRRRIYLAYGEPGWVVAQQFFAPLERLGEQALEGFSHEERTAAARVLTALVGVFTDYAAETDAPPPHEG